MYSAKITLKYDSTWEQTRGIYDEVMIPEEHITFETPVEDMNTIQLFQFFAKFAAAMGHNEVGIAKGACYVAFNEMRSTEAMRKTAEEYDLVLKEDHIEKIREYDEQFHQFCDTIQNMGTQIRGLKAKLSRLENPDNPQYTDEEMDAMTVEATDGSYKPWGDYVPGSREAVMLGCKCPVMDNKEMPDDKKWVNGDCPIHGKEK